MKVNLYRSGGFAGMITGWEVQVDEQPDPLQWQILVDSCPWDDPAPGTNGADRFIYEFKTGRRRVKLGETEVAGPWRVLADRVRENGRRMPVAELTHPRR